MNYSLVGVYSGKRHLYLMWIVFSFFLIRRYGDKPCDVNVLELACGFLSKWKRKVF